MQRRLIMICGISGVGKTTLTGEVLKTFDSVRYLQTYSTRAPRAGEENTFEHMFVSRQRYEYLRSQSNNWNHLDIYETYYGIDIEAQLKRYATTQNFITIVSPVTSYLDEMREQFPGDSCLIYFDVDQTLAANRLIETRPDSEKARITVDTDLALSSVKSSADFVFIPKHRLDEDIISFTDLIRSLLLVSSMDEYGRTSSKEKTRTS